MKNNLQNIDDDKRRKPRLSTPTQSNHDSENNS